MTSDIYLFHISKIIRKLICTMYKNIFFSRNGPKIYLSGNRLKMYDCQLQISINTCICILGKVDFNQNKMRQYIFLLKKLWSIFVRQVYFMSIFLKSCEKKLLSNTKKTEKTRSNIA